MTNESGSFQVGIEFSSVLAAISKQIYDTPYAFLRENLQNAIDASRMQARRGLISPSDPSLRIDIKRRRRFRSYPGSRHWNVVRRLTPPVLDDWCQRET